jgi:hypothetical protein
MCQKRPSVSKETYQALVIRLALGPAEDGGKVSTSTSPLYPTIEIRFYFRLLKIFEFFHDYPPPAVTPAIAQRVSVLRNLLHAGTTQNSIFIYYTK